MGGCNWGLRIAAVEMERNVLEGRARSSLGREGKKKSPKCICKAGRTTSSHLPSSLSYIFPYSKKVTNLFFSFFLTYLVFSKA